MPPSDLKHNHNVDAIVVSFNSGAALSEQLRAPGIRASFDSILVVDNASGDDSAAIAESAGVNLLRRATNGGLSVALNDGLAKTQAEFVAVLNPDVLIQDPDLVTALLRHFGDPQVGLVAPRLRLPDGTDQDSARRVPTPIQLVARRITGRNFGALHPKASADVPWVVLACVILRRSALEAIGGFDPHFFLYFEDVDLCVRLWRAGWKVRLDTERVAYHAFQAESRLSVLGPAQAHHRRSARRFFRKYPAALWGGLRLGGRTD